MPIYEYQCRKCNEVSEILQLNRNSKEVCPKCGADALEKLISTVNTSIKGPSSGCDMAGSCGVPSSCCAGGHCGLK